MFGTACNLPWGKRSVNASRLLPRSAFHRIPCIVIEPSASTRRISATAKLLAGNPEDVIRVLELLDDDPLHNLSEAIFQVQRLRALKRGDLDAIIAEAFEEGFGSDGLGLLPWTVGNVVVCPGGLVSKSSASHKCRFISVNDQWVWESGELIREDKRSTPGKHDGFRAIAIIPLLEGTKLDVVSGKARSGQHSVDRVISFEVKAGDLVEVAQRIVRSAGMR